MTKKLYTPAERVAELVAEHGSYRAAAEASGFGLGHLHRIGAGEYKLLTWKSLEKLGLRSPAKFPLANS